jgi:hypothetical protein
MGVIMGPDPQPETPSNPVPAPESPGDAPEDDGTLDTESDEENAA